MASNGTTCYPRALESRVQHRSPWTSTEGLAAPDSFLAARGEHISLPGRAPTSWHLDTPSLFKAGNMAPSLLLFWGPWWLHQTPPQITHNHLPIARSLSKHLCRVPVACNVTYPRFPGIRTWTCLRGGGMLLPPSPLLHRSF